MRRLMLLRHAKTERDSPTGRDRDRRLDERGRTDAGVIGDWMVRHSALPDRVLVSTAVRTRETWDLLPEAIRRIPVEHVGELYMAEPSDILEVIHTVQDEPKRLLIIAHNPGLHEIAVALTKHGDAAARHELNRNLPTCGLLTIALPVKSWDEVSLHTGTLEQFVTPKLLRGQAGAD